MTDYPLENQSRASLALRRLGPGSLLMTLNLFAAAVFFSYGIQSLIVAWQTPEYSHGPIIPLLSFYMFLREMREVPPSPGPVTDRTAGVAVVIFALLIALLGLLVRIPDIVTYGFILWVGGTVLTCFGLKRGWYFWPSVLHLVFMLPLPQFIYWPVSLWLQTVSSEIGVEIVRWFDIPVLLDGHTIDLGTYKLLVAEACSGLRYLFPVMSFSYVFGVLYNGPRWHKIVLLLAAAPITVLMNSVRIGIIGVLVDNYGISHAEGFLHAFEGWVIFIACIAMLFGLAALMQRLTPNPKPIGESIDLDFDGIGDQIRRYLAIPMTRALTVATGVVALFAAVWSVGIDREPVVPERRDLALFPAQIGDWQASPRIVPGNVRRVLGADDYLAYAYRDRQTGHMVDFWIAYYDKLTEGSGIHSPEVCIPAGGWEVGSWEPKTILLDNGDSLTVNKAMIRKDSSRQLVYYWFQQTGRRLTSDYSAKFYTIYDSLTRGRTDGALVRYITPIASGEPVAAAEARLNEMLNLTVPKLSAYVPD